MRTRLAMVSCKGPHTTPWMTPQGGETSFRVLHLLEGEWVLLQEGDSQQRLDQPGEYPFAPRERFRFTKDRHQEVEGSPTMVEVIYNG